MKRRRLITAHQIGYIPQNNLRASSQSSIYIKLR